MIRIFKNLNLLEKKDHIIKKMPNLTQEQKDELISFFQTHPNYEGQIDWNKWQTLTFEDFKEVLNIQSKTAKKKQVKQSGIKGLTEGEDYFEIKGLPKYMNGYIPLNYEASKFIASEYVGGCEGKWCTAYQKDDSYWYDYTKQKNIVLIYFIVNTDIGDARKIAVAFNMNNSTIEIFDHEDKSMVTVDFEEITGVTISLVIDENFKLIEKAHEILKEQKSTLDSIIIKLTNGEELDNEEQEYFKEIFDNQIEVGIEKISFNPLEVIIDFDYYLFPYANDRNIIDKYISKDFEFVEFFGIYDMDNDNAFHELKYSLTSKAEKDFNNFISKKFNIKDFDIDDYDNIDDLIEAIEDEDFIDELIMVIKQSMEDAMVGAFYRDLYKAYEEAGNQIGDFVGEIYEKKVKLHDYVILQLLTELQVEIEDGESIEVEDYWDLDLGIDFDRYEPMIDDNYFSEIFMDRLMELQ